MAEDLGMVEMQVRYKKDGPLSPGAWKKEFFYGTNYPLVHGAMACRKVFSHLWNAGMIIPNDDIACKSHQSMHTSAA